MTYDLAKTTLGVGRTLMDVLNAHQLYALDESEVVHRSVTFDKPELLTPKDDYFFKAGPVVGLEWEIVGRMARLLRGNVRIDPSTFVGTVVYANAVTDEGLRLSLDQLPLGDDRVVPGRFYFIYHLLNYYHCPRVERRLGTWEMIKSFQCGDLIRATITQDENWARSYIPVPTSRRFAVL